MLTFFLLNLIIFDQGGFFNKSFEISGFKEDQDDSPVEEKDTFTSNYIGGSVFGEIFSKCWLFNEQLCNLNLESNFFIFTQRDYRSLRYGLSGSMLLKNFDDLYYSLFSSIQFKKSVFYLGLLDYYDIHLFNNPNQGNRKFFNNPMNFFRSNFQRPFSLAFSTDLFKRDFPYSAIVSLGLERGIQYIYDVCSLKKCSEEKRSNHDDSIGFSASLGMYAPLMVSELNFVTAHLLMGYNRYFNIYEHDYYGSFESSFYLKSSFMNFYSNFYFLQKENIIDFNNRFLAFQLSLPIFNEYGVLMNHSVANLDGNISNNSSIYASYQSSLFPSLTLGLGVTLNHDRKIPLPSLFLSII